VRRVAETHPLKSSAESSVSERARRCYRHQIRVPPLP
jgi:hypothetical protein